MADSYDNAMAEALNGTYKAEMVRLHGPWRTRAELETATINWIYWYNEKRLHGQIGDIAAELERCGTPTLPRAMTEPSIPHALRYRYGKRVATCSYCDNTFIASGRRRYCSDACRQAYRRRGRAPAPEPIRVPQHDTVYEARPASPLSPFAAAHCNQSPPSHSAPPHPPHNTSPTTQKLLTTPITYQLWTATLLSPTTRQG